MKDLTFAELLAANRALERGLTGEHFDILALSNLTIHPAKEILEYELRSQGVPATAHIGNFDNIVQDSTDAVGKAVLLFWDLANLAEDLHARSESMTAGGQDELFSSTVERIDLVLRNLAHVPLVLMNTFSALPFTMHWPEHSVLDSLAFRLNAMLRKRQESNLRLVDIDKLFVQLSVGRAVNWRTFYNGRALYSVEFYRHYAEFVSPWILSIAGKGKKALLLDCDNTLWGGILGEDGRDGITVGGERWPGPVFAEIQQLAIRLYEQGVLLGLCSKNNAADVDEVLAVHDDMRIRELHLAVKRVNWDAKTDNLSSIAEELNIGRDALLFLDDSAYEVELVRNQLPEIEAWQVPEALQSYPQQFRRLMARFASLTRSAEDAQRGEQYREEQRRREERNEHRSIEDFLASLGLEMTIYKDDPALVPRLAQMTQKTNQFNLTTRRYTEGDILRFIEAENVLVFAFSVRDRFGDSGVTGMAVLTLQTGRAEIDTFLMSCRVIGRKLEFALMDQVTETLKELSIPELHASFHPTSKNAQVQEFYEHCGFNLLENMPEGDKYYTLKIDRYSPVKSPYIRIHNAG